MSLTPHARGDSSARKRSRMAPVLPAKLAVAAVAGCVAIILGCAPPQAHSATTTTPPAVQKDLLAAIQGSWRTPAFVKRDQYRHPLKTLEFFGIRPDMRVIEVLPGAGWYTEILAPFLRDHGQLIEATSPVAGSSGFMQRMAQRYEQKLAADPAVYGNVRFQPFELPGYLQLGPPDSADMVVTFNNMHDLMFENVHHEETPVFLETFLRNAFDVLKPGGILGIAGHRCKAGTPVPKCFPWARLPQAFVIHEAERAGLKLVDTSEALANPKDPGDISVFHLPPTLADKSAAGRRHYAAIGYADDYLLKFVKPGD